MPAWSKNGNKIAFSRAQQSSFEIYVMNRDRTGLTNLTNHPADDFGPDWGK
jgi:Tol biopolymer transport system component